MKKAICILLIICMALGCTACGGSSYGLKVIQTLVEQDYSLAFRTDDPTASYVIAALGTLAAEGKVAELSMKWFGEKIVEFKKTPGALEKLGPVPERDFIIGVDVNSFPMAYIANDEYWGFDVELAIAVCERLGWNLKIQQIEKENVFVELSSGNIDCAWGGIALDEKETAKGKYLQYGPYVHNDIVIAARDGSFIWNKLMLSGKKMVMSSTPEALAALESDEKLAQRMSQITRLAGGATECFQYLFAGRCDTILADSTALYYFNCH